MRAIVIDEPGPRGELRVAELPSPSLLPGQALVRLPDALPFEQAAFLHCTAAVALRALRDRARAVAGETVVVTGASGGVGIHAIQVARILGCRPIAITSHAEKAEALARAGAA